MPFKTRNLAGNKMLLRAVLLRTLPHAEYLRWGKGSGLGFGDGVRVWGKILGLSSGLAFGLEVLGLGFWVLGLGFWALGFGFWVLGFGFWVLDFGFWVLGFGFWVWGIGY